MAVYLSVFTDKRLKSLHIRRKYLLPVMACLLLLVAFLASNFWLTLGVMGFLYILTIPVTCWLFVRTRAAFEGEAAGEKAAE